MATPLAAPCVNINDEVVQVVALNVQPGDVVQTGDVVAAVETDKSLVDVVAERGGHVLRVDCETGRKVRVGAPLLWLGDSPNEAVPEIPTPAAPAEARGREPTAKARALLASLGLDASIVPASGERLTVADIEAWLARSGAQAPTAQLPRAAPEAIPDVAGELEELSPEAAAMLHTVTWHRDQAVAAYLELEYDPKPWEECATQYAGRNKLLLSPLLPLMAFRLVTLGRERGEINATIADGRRYRYRPINLGFTVQVGAMLYLTVVRDAQEMDAASFIDALGAVQRRAIARKLPPQEASGATLSFSSMARWNVSRHVPVLPPRTALIVAHAAPRDSGRAVLGATYDHRLLTGFDVAQVLQALSRPPA